MKQKLSHLLLIGSIVLSMVLTGCKKEENCNSSQPETGTFTDARDGKVYKWVKIGNQTWMAENLAYQPNNLNGYIAYNNDQANVAIYGYLYKYDTARQIAPDGWHLPTKAELRTLVNELGGDVPAYNKLLESGTAHWLSPNNATNDSGFTALPGGYYDSADNEFRGLGELTIYVSADYYPNSTTAVMVLKLNRNMAEASVEGNPVRMYFSVRCIKN